MYTDLIFDLYGTLVDIHTEENPPVWEKTALYFGYYGAHYTGEELEKAFSSQIQARKAKAGQSYECFPDIPFHHVMADLFRAKGITENADALGIQAAQLFRICSTDYIRLYPHVLESPKQTIRILFPNFLPSFLLRQILTVSAFTIRKAFGVVNGNTYIIWIF